jgi:predicted amidophosphoribosyltransferase
MLSAAERHRNVHAAFRIKSDTRLDGEHVAVVDDTMTTGATAEEIAGLLKERGASQVTICVVSRAMAEWRNTVGQPIKPE